MAVEGVTLDAMSGGVTIAVDRIDSKDFQLLKLVTGDDGTNGGMVTDANPYPTKIISIAAGDNNIGNVDIASSALPSGAATSALQTTGNTALTAIQTAVEIIDNAISGNEMQVDIVSMPTVTIQDGGNTITVDGTVAATQSGTWNVATVTAVTSITNPVAVTGTFFQATQPVSIASLPALAAGTNNIGDVDVLTLPALPTGSNVIGAVTQSGTWNVGTVTTVTTVSAVTAITNALPAGTNAIGKLAANSGVDIGDVDVTSISAGTNLIGDVGLQGRTTGGLSIFRSIDLDESEEEVKGSAGTLYSIDAMNMTNAPLYLKIYDNTAAGTTVGTTTPVLTYVLPTNGDTNGCGMVKNILQGLAFATGITVAVTTGLADNNTGAPAANAAIINLGYK